MVAAAKQGGVDAGVFTPGQKAKPPASAGSSAESGLEPPAVVNFKGNGAAEMRRIAGVKPQERYSHQQQQLEVEERLDRESLNQSWSQWFMYGTSAPVGLIRHSIMSSLYDMEAVRKLAFPRAHCNSASKGESHFRRSMSVLDAEYPVLHASGTGLDVTIGYRLYPFRRCADRTALLHAPLRPLPMSSSTCTACACSPPHTSATSCAHQEKCPAPRDRPLPRQCRNGG